MHIWTIVHGIQIWSFANIVQNNYLLIILFIKKKIYLFIIFFVQSYIELANSYSTGKIAELEQYVRTNEEKFESVSFLLYTIHSILCFG